MLLLLETCASVCADAWEQARVGGGCVLEKLLLCA